MAILKRCILFLLVLTPISGSAQNSTATLTGQVMDASGAALPGVTVTLSSPNTGGASMTSVTDQQGTYRFNLSQAGTYKAQFELAGFRTLIIESIPVILGADRT